MHGAFLQDLALVMIVAGVVTIIFHRLKQPVVLGYILAGLIVGPYTDIPLSVHDHRTVEIMSELGVILLMFSLGLHFSLRKLAKVGATALIAATLEIVAMAAIGYGVGRFFGWSSMDSLFLGAILSISSTTIIIKALGELGRTKEKFARLIFGILIVEDILAIAMLALLSGIAMTGTMSIGNVLTTLGRLGVFLTVVLVLGLLAVPALLRYVAKFKSNEMMLITVLGLCFGVALLALKLDYSVALGAFLIGAIVAEARELGRIETLIEPVRDMFSAVFFVAIGMLIDPALVVRYAVPISLVTVAVVAGKVLSCTLGTFLAGNDARTSLRVGMGLAQIGEFSFIIAQLGLTLKVTSGFLYPIAVAVSAITTLLTPYLIRASDPLAAWLGRVVPAPVIGYLHGYTGLVASLGGGGERDDLGQIRKMIRKGVLQIVLNMVLAVGLLIAAAQLGEEAEKWLPDLPAWIGGAGAMAWLAAVILALPLLIASFRKLRGVSMVLAELSVPRTEGPEDVDTLRNVIGNVIFIAGGAGLVIILLAVSSTILPPWPVLVVLLVAIGAVAVLMWRSFIRIYSKAQVTLRDVLTSSHPIGRDNAQNISPMLKDAALETVLLTESSPARGKLIRELELRTHTGASVVGIERDGENIVNPGPDEELRPGDKVLLIGTHEHLVSAGVLLNGERAA